jgi:hypothetical protein
MNIRFLNLHALRLAVLVVGALASMQMPDMGFGDIP